MPLNHYVTLGRSGLRVSPFCLGTMTFGLDWEWGSDVDESCRIMDRYIEFGGNFIDTANIYTKGHSEAIIGDHIGQHPAKRDRLVIATKFLSNLYPGDPNAGGAHRKSIMAACEQSLRRLKTDYIDLCWMHWLDALTPIDETMRTIDDLVRQGKVRYFGISDTPAYKCVQMQYEAIFKNWTPSIALQIEYSLVQRTVEHELVPMAREMGMGITPWSPLKGGLLSGKYTRHTKPDETPGKREWLKDLLVEPRLTIIDELIAVAREAECTPAQAALAWVQAKPGVTSTIIGARTLGQLEDNVKALDVTLSAGQVARLDEASAPPPHFPNSFLDRTYDNTFGGTTINGRSSEVWEMAPQNDDERW